MTLFQHSTSDPVLYDPHIVWFQTSILDEVGCTEGRLEVTRPLVFVLFTYLHTKKLAYTQDSTRLRMSLANQFNCMYVFLFLLTLLVSVLLSFCKCISGRQTLNVSTSRTSVTQQKTSATIRIYEASTMQVFTTQHSVTVINKLWWYPLWTGSCRIPPTV
jgi:hypothetical protein